MEDNYKNAFNAKEKLRKLLNRKDWFRGAHVSQGIVSGIENFSIIVRASYPSDDLSNVPRNIDSFSVFIEVVVDDFKEIPDEKQSGEPEFDFADVLGTELMNKHGLKTPEELTNLLMVSEVMEDSIVKEIE